MTATQVIWLLFIGMLVNFAGMRYFWLRSERDEEEIKKLKAENERKDRLLKAREKDVDDLSYLKRLQTMSEEEKKVYLMGNWTYTSHPCERCDTGWGSVGTEGVHTCKETCERLAAWNEKQKKEG